VYGLKDARLLSFVIVSQLHLNSPNPFPNNSFASCVSLQQNLISIPLSLGGCAPGIVVFARWSRIPSSKMTFTWFRTPDTISHSKVHSFLLISVLSMGILSWIYRQINGSLISRLYWPRPFLSSRCARRSRIHRRRERC
jgi:hypothetical protein